MKKRNRILVLVLVGVISFVFVFSVLSGGLEGGFTLTSGPLPPNELVTELDPGSTLTVSWQEMSVGEDLNFTIHTTGEDIQYTLESPTQKLRQNMPVISPELYPFSVDESGPYYLHLTNTDDSSNFIEALFTPYPSRFAIDNSELAKTRETEFPVALIAAISGIVSSGITAMTSIYLAKKEKKHKASSHAVVITLSSRR